MQLLATTMSSASVARIVSKPRKDGTERYDLNFSGWDSSGSSKKKDRDGESEEAPKSESPLKSEFRLLCAILDDSPFYEHAPTDRILTGRLADAMESPLPGIAELVAARKIRMFARRLRSVPAAGPVTKHFTSCTTCPQLRQFSPRQRMLFLGPLPHALACLDGLAAYFGSRKAQLAAVLQKAAHNDLETAGRAVAQVQYVFPPFHTVGIGSR